MFVKTEKPGTAGPAGVMTRVILGGSKVKQHLLRSTALGIVGIAVLSGAGASAQTILEEITVTAERRTESLTRVPVAVSSLSGARLEAQQVNTVEDVQKFVPSLSFGKGGTNRNSNLSLRGVGTISFSVGAEPSVSTLVDGVVLARAGQAFTELYDLQRVEVLKGPQGTLYGKNASSGVVHFISKGPSEELEGQVSTLFAEDGEYRVRGMVSGPLSDSIGIRVNGFYGSLDGIVRNVAQGRDVEGYERYGARTILDFNPGDRFRARLIADWSKTDDDCCAEFVRRDDGSIRAKAVLLGGATLPTGEGPIKEGAINAAQRTQNETYGFSLDMGYDYDGFSLTSISSYREWDNVERQDIDDGPFGATERDGDIQSGITLGSVDGVLVGQATARDFGPQTWEQWTQEVRIASDESGPFRWQGGIYLGFSNVDRQFSRFDALCINDPNGLLGGVDISGLSATSMCPTTNIVLPSATAFMTVDNDTYAIFGHGTYEFDEQWSLTGGVRLTHDQISFSHIRERVGDEFRDILGNQDGNPNNDGGVFALQVDQGLETGKAKNTNLSGSVSLNYQWDEDLFVYAKYSRGYKGPAFNNFFNALNAENLGFTRTPDFNGSFTPIDAESSNAYELGFKWELDRAVLTVTGFRQDYQNFQANSFIITAGAVTTNLTNAGDVTTQGIEFEVRADLSDTLTAYGGVTFADAEIRNFCKGFDSTLVGQTCNPRKGEDLPFAPKVKGSFTLDYDRPVGNGINLLVSNNIVFQSESFGALNENPNEQIDGYFLYNASVGVSFDEGKYELRVFGKNLFDQSYIVATNEGGAVARLPRDQERYFGVQLRAGF